MSAPYPRPRCTATLTGLTPWIAGLILYLSSFTQALAFDLVVAKGSSAESRTPGNALLFALGREWDAPSAERRGWEGRLRTELSGARLDGRGDEITLYGLSLYGRGTSGMLYLEAGIGVHYLSDARFAGKNLGTRTQFSPSLGVGLRLGRQLEVGYWFWHLSNGGLATPNPGLNYHLLRLGYRF